MASSTKLAPGVVAKVCLSLSPHLSSLLASFFGLEFVGDQHFSNSTSRSVAGAVIFLVAQRFSLSQLFTGNLASAMHSALPSDVHSLCLVACVSTTLPLALQTLPALFHHTKHMVALVRVRSSIPVNPTSWPRWHFSGFPVNSCLARICSFCLSSRVRFLATLLSRSLRCVANRSHRSVGH